MQSVHLFLVLACLPLIFGIPVGQDVVLSTTPVTNSSRYPFVAHSNYKCSGIFIAKNIVLTAACMT
jgi:hypothetical protein